MRRAALLFAATETGHLQAAGPQANSSTFQPNLCMFKAVEFSSGAYFCLKHASFYFKYYSDERPCPFVPFSVAAANTFSQDVLLNYLVGYKTRDQTQALMETCLPSPPWLILVSSRAQGCRLGPPSSI